jgi:hypothetical protein
MKKLKMVVDILTVADVCIEAFESWAQLLEFHSKGTSKKKEDQEVNTIDWGDRKDHGYRGKQSSDQKEKRHFWRPDDTEKWCEIHRTVGHDLEECKTFMNRKKMSPPVVLVP